MLSEIGMEEAIKVGLYTYKYDEFRAKDFSYQALVSASLRLQPSTNDNLVIYFKNWGLLNE